MIFENRFTSLAGKSATHFSYRNYAIAKILKDSLGGNRRVLVIATLYPSIHFFNKLIQNFTKLRKSEMILNEAIEISWKSDIEISKISERLWKREADVLKMMPQIEKKWCWK